MSLSYTIFFYLSITILLFQIPFVSGDMSSTTPKYISSDREIESIRDLIFPYTIHGNSEIIIDVSSVDVHGDDIEISFDIPSGFVSTIYFKDAKTEEVWYTYNYSGKGEEGGVAYGYIKNTAHKCKIGLSGPGKITIMYIPHGLGGGDMESAYHIVSFYRMIKIRNPAYFIFKVPKDVCVYAFNPNLELSSFDESNSTRKKVIIKDDDWNTISMEFFVLYNRSGGPINNVILEEYGPYNDRKELSPAVGGVILISITLIAVVAYIWIRRRY